MMSADSTPCFVWAILESSWVRRAHGHLRGPLPHVRRRACASSNSWLEMLFFAEQVLHAPEGHLRESELRFRGGHAVLGLGDPALRLLFRGLGLEQGGLEIP